MRISDWSSDVCSSDLIVDPERDRDERNARRAIQPLLDRPFFVARVAAAERDLELVAEVDGRLAEDRIAVDLIVGERRADLRSAAQQRSEEHTSELQSLMRSSYAVFCLKKIKDKENHEISTITTTQ